MFRKISYVQIFLLSIFLICTSRSNAQSTGSSSPEEQILAAIQKSVLALSNNDASIIESSTFSVDDKKYNNITIDFPGAMFAGYFTEDETFYFTTSRITSIETLYYKGDDKNNAFKAFSILKPIVQKYKTLLADGTYEILDTDKPFKENGEGRVINYWVTSKDKKVPTVMLQYIDRNKADEKIKVTLEFYKSASLD